MTGPQRVLITGGASGIGRAMADAFLEDGALVHVADVDGTADLFPGGGFTAADVSDPSDVDRLFDCLLYTSPSSRDQRGSRMPSSA